ncbi:hypothetical protein PAJ34TS1_60000 [Paenibacillus azoreducens]|uniref:Uncharacterized protein n=2 Tax=Paenibacillus azoreducens TaxID=116718 RepID=A0A919YI51_9BACL|nr:hypothetical protein J34TS1_64120 [Paenibacillus azoreducens]
MLSNSITGTRENVAATEKAVKLAVEASQIPYTNKTLIDRGISGSITLGMYTFTDIDFTKKVRDTFKYSASELRVKKSGIYAIGLYTAFWSDQTIPKGTTMDV